MGIRPGLWQNFWPCFSQSSTCSRSASAHRRRTRWGRWWRRGAFSTASSRGAAAMERGCGVSLHGSLAYTGKGHGTDRAVDSRPRRAKRPTASTPTTWTRSSPRWPARKSVRLPAGHAIGFRSGERSGLRLRAAADGSCQRHGVHACGRRTTTLLPSRTLLFDRRRLRADRGRAQPQPLRQAAVPPADVPYPVSAMPARCWPWATRRGLTHRRDEARQRGGRAWAADARRRARRDLGGDEWLHRARPGPEGIMPGGLKVQAPRAPMC